MDGQHCKRFVVGPLTGSGIFGGRRERNSFLWGEGGVEEMQKTIDLYRHGAMLDAREKDKLGRDGKGEAGEEKGVRRGKEKFALFLFLPLNFSFLSHVFLLFACPLWCRDERGWLCPTIYNPPPPHHHYHHQKKPESPALSFSKSPKFGGFEIVGEE